MSTPRPDVDALARRLQQSLQQRRFRRWRILVPLVLLALAALGLALWSIFWERAELVPLSVVALNTLVTQDETPRVRAVLIAPEEAGSRRVAGREIIFLDAAPPAGGALPRLEKTSTDRAGYAELPWPVPAGSTAGAFRARYIDAGRRHKSEDGGQIYRWPADAALLLIDVEGMLAEPPPQTGRLHAPILPSAPPGAAEALDAVRDDVRVVYLLASTDSWLTARRLRGWVEDRFAQRSGFPPGPVLGRLDFAATGADDTRRAALTALQQRFKGPLVALTRRRDAATEYTRQKVGVLWFGPDAPAADVPSALSWNDVADKVRLLTAKKL